MQDYPWPGNIRELENRINGAVIMAEGKQVTVADLGLADGGADTECLNLRTARQRAESQAIRRALALAARQPVARRRAARHHPAHALRPAGEEQHRGGR